MVFGASQARPDDLAWGASGSLCASTGPAKTVIVTGRSAASRASQDRSGVRAVHATQPPIAEMAPDASASGMKRAGSSHPWSGRAHCQRATE